MNTVSKLLVGFSVPVLFILLSQTGTADTMEAKVASGKTEVTTLAGGCFWCTESDLEKLPGVLDVVSGYSGGKEENPTYRQVASGRTGHIEVISVKFDTNVVSYEEVLDHFSAISTRQTTKGHSLIAVLTTVLLFSITISSRNRLPSNL